jgi:hypothetical protein
MIFRTIIKKATKSLVKSESNTRFTQREDNDDEMLVDEMPKNAPIEIPEAEYEEVNENVDVETGEVTEEVKVEQEKVDDEF